MANITKIKRDQMLAFLEELKTQHTDDASIRAFNEIENQLTEKKFGLVFEEHTEEVEEMLKENIPVLCADETRRLCKDESLPWNFIIEGDNLQALYLLEKTHRGMVDCIYIDPPYNTGATDWKYNNNYVVKEDVYRHSKWLSMMKSRLFLAKRLLNPNNSVLICTIDEKECLHLGCLLEEMFPEARTQMISSVINVKGVAKKESFSRSSEYLFVLMFGESAPQKTKLNDEWLGNVQTTSRNKLRVANMMRFGSDGTRKANPNLFYPIYISEDEKCFVKFGDPLLDMTKHPNDIPVPEGTKAIWPIHRDGTEARWGYSNTSIRELLSKGYLHIGAKYKYGRSIMFIQPGWQSRIESGKIAITGYGEDGFVITDSDAYKPEFVPGDTWMISTHNATEYGQKIMQKFIGKRFDYPKSIYAVHDIIRFFVANKPNALIIDFFAGSGTTFHAVNLLNAEDEGHRRCIMVTNNELSVDEEKRLTKDGYKKGDAEWESLGIAKYVTWPRTVCSIEGHDINGKPLKGDYLVNDADENPIPMSQGFSANVKYFKCDWTPRKPETYLLSNALCLHIKEMIELQNAIEVDNVKNVLILNKSDFKNIILNPDIYAGIENIWINQNMILNADEMNLLKAKGFNYIPREFFSQELKEAAE